MQVGPGTGVMPLQGPIQHDMQSMYMHRVPAKAGDWWWKAYDVSCVCVIIDVMVLQRALHIPRNTVHMLTLTSVNVGHPGCIPQAIHCLQCRRFHYFQVAQALLLGLPA